MASIILTTAIIFAFFATDAAAATPSASPESSTIVVEVSGTVPGYTQAQLAGYLARRMQEEIAAPWHFVASQPAGQTAPNRAVWSFKTLRKVWKGGSHSGFPSPVNLETYLRAEVKLYLNGNYQMTMDTHPSVGDEPDNKALSGMVHDAAHALFIENRPETP